MITALPAAAAGDAISAVNNLSTFVFSVLKAIGVIAAAFGLVQFAISLQGHDPAQRTQGLLILVGGLIVYFAKEILDMITGG